MGEGKLQEIQFLAQEPELLFFLEILADVTQVEIKDELYQAA